MHECLKTLFNHERYQTIAVIVTCLLLIWFYGCESTCQSLIDPTKKLNAIELQGELDLILAKAENGRASIEQQEQLKKTILQQAIIAAQTGTINPIALLTSVGTILGIGATVDNVRKRKEIKTLHNSNST